MYLGGAWVVVKALIILTLLHGVAMGAWYDKNLPFGDTSETYRSAGGAVAVGVGWPMLLSASHDKIFGKPKTFDGKVARTVGSKLLAALIAEALWHGKTARHDTDAKNLNAHMANVATIAPALIWDALTQHKQDKKEEAAKRREREVEEAKMRRIRKLYKQG